MDAPQTIPLTAQNKNDWNNFQDHLNGDFPTTGALNQFNGLNPKSTITAEHIPAAINYIQSLKNNPDVPGLTPAYKNGNNMRFPVYADGSHLEMPDQQPPKYVTQLQPADEQKYQQWKKQLPGSLGNDSDYDLRGMYKENPNVKPSANLHFSDKYKQPNHITFSDESIYNGKDGQKGGHWGRQGNQDTFEATDQNIKNAGGVQQLQDYFKKKEPNVKLVLPPSGKGGTGPPQMNDTGNPIPKPDYSDPNSRNRFAQQFTKKYGPWMEGRGDTPLRINETMDEATDSAKNLHIKAAKAVGLDPTLLYASNMEEGMSGLFANKKGESDTSGNKDYPTPGFHSFGIDFFRSKVPGLIKKGYLPADFKNQYTPHDQINELGQKVDSADFKSPDAAIQASAALVKDFQDQAESFAKKNNINLTPKQKEFFALAGYNGGGNMQKMMLEYNKKGALKDDSFIANPNTGSYPTIHTNIGRRILMRDALVKEGENWKQ